MTGAMARTPLGRRILMSSMDGVEFSGDAADFSGMMFGFYEEGGSPDSFSTDSADDDHDDRDNETEQGGDQSSLAESKAFWETQHQLLHGTLSRTSSLESRIRKTTKEVLKELQLVGTTCFCQIPVMGGCRACLMSNISDRLRNDGFNSAICKSKWRSSPDIPAGEHTYIDVVDKNSNKEVRVVIELNFRAEFVMARASDEYNQLVDRLPEVFVGKAERLRNLIKIACSGAKKCTKERKMHMGPWRKHKYMQAKWFGPCKRTMPTSFQPEGISNKLHRPKSSMLTFDLLEKLPSLQCTAVKVL